MMSPRMKCSTIRHAPSRRCLVLLAIAAAPLGDGCRRAPTAAPTPDPDQVLATWSGGVIKRAEIETGYAKRLAAEPGATPERRAELLRLSLERRARIELLYREALAQGLPDRADVKAVLRAQGDRLLAEDWLQRHVIASAHAEDGQVETEMARRTATPGQETRRFGHIFLRAPASDAAARARAAKTMAQVRKELAAGAAFDELARKYSDSITARGGGEVEWTTRAALHPAAAAVVFALWEGQVSGVVETEAGLQVFRLDGIRRPAAIDLTAVRDDVRRTLGAEAGRAAAQAERQRVWDDAGLAVDVPALARPARDGEVVATVAGERLTRAELDHARSAWNAWSAPGDPPPPADLVRVLVVNRLLARRRRETGIDAALQKKLADATRNVVVDARRLELVGTIPVEITAAEIDTFYAKHRDSAPFLRDHVVDLLFFPQQGDSAAAVYAQGEVVSRQLRDGTAFDRILASVAGRAVVAQRLSMGDLDSLRVQSARLAKSLAQLRPGEVSAPLYLDGERVSFTKGRPASSVRGLAFVRLASVQPLLLASVRQRVREALVAQKRSEGVAAVQQGLNARVQLKILVDRL